MSAAPAADVFAAMRRLALASILVAIVSVLATIGALMRLPNAGATGQRIVMSIGGAVALATFLFGALTSARKPLARPVGWTAVAGTVLAAALFALLTYVVPDSRWLFAAWTLALLTYAAIAAPRLVRWPGDDWHDIQKSPVSIFISYRRQDSHETVGRIHDRLLERFEEQRIFLDVDDQAAGEDYRVVIAHALEHTDVVVAIIGTRWLATVDEHGRRRLDDPNDMVRIELETALGRNLRVIPVLVEGAGMPDAESLPPSLRPLRYRTAAPMRPDPDFKNDLQALIAALCEGGRPQAR